MKKMYEYILITLSAFLLMLAAALAVQTAVRRQ